MTTESTLQEDYEMARYIYKILSSKFFIMTSWGFHNPVTIKDGLQFNVNGFIHKGVVQVEYQHGLDLFLVRLLSTTNELVKEIDRLYFDQLIEVIDENVEKVQNYNERVKMEYPNIHFEE